MIRPKDEIFQYYFYFIQKRMEIFWNKYNSIFPLTDDEVLQNYKFTNVYRALDRVSQYLINNVIYNNDTKFNDKDILFRILFFKIFNKIETWEYLESKLGQISTETFDLKKINKYLALRKDKTPIFSNAYMMTGTHSKYNHLTYKHEKWLEMVKNEMLNDKVFERIIKAKSFEQVYNLLRCSIRYLF